MKSKETIESQSKETMPEERSLGSITAATYPIIAALVKAEDMGGMGRNRVWQPTNDEQRRFLEIYFTPQREDVTGIPEIESMASWEVGQVNDFLRRKGFRIQLAPFQPQEFGAASVLDLLVEWFQKGERTRLTGRDDNREYDAVRIPKEGVRIELSDGHDKPVAILRTKSGDEVYMTPLDTPMTGLDLVSQAVGIQRSFIERAGFSGLVFPMVDLDQEVDIGWLKGMHTTGENGSPALVSQALQQNKLRMNEVGARAESAVGMGMTLGISMPKPEFVINSPFLTWFSRQGLGAPLFTGYIDYNSWRDPGDIRG